MILNRYLEAFATYYFCMRLNRCFGHSGRNALTDSIGHTWAFCFSLSLIALLGSLALASLFCGAESRLMIV